MYKKSGLVKYFVIFSSSFFGIFFKGACILNYMGLGTLTHVSVDCLIYYMYNNLISNFEQIPFTFADVGKSKLQGNAQSCGKGFFYCV